MHWMLLGYAFVCQQSTLESDSSPAFKQNLDSYYDYYFMSAFIAIPSSQLIAILLAECGLFRPPL